MNRKPTRTINELLLDKVKMEMTRVEQKHATMRAPFGALRSCLPKHSI